MKKIIIMLLLCFCFFVKVDVSGSTLSLASNSKSTILIESQTGKIIYEDNKNFRLSLASMTKIMTLSIIFDYIENGSLKLTDNITCSAYAASMGGSQVYLEEGETHDLDTFIKCIAIASGNDAAVAVGEHIADSEEGFVKLMNDKVEELDLKNTNFMDCTGLTTKNHYSSAYDVAQMSRYLINTYPEVLEYTSITDTYFREDSDNPFWLVNTNKLVRTIEGVDGLKTGWTQDAGYCISTTMEKNNMRLISVVMGYENVTLRNVETMELLNYGFANYEKVLLLEKEKVISQIKDIRLKPSVIKLVLEEDLYIVKQINEDISNIDIKYNILDYSGNVEAYLNNELVGSCNIVSLTSIEKSNFFDICKNLFLSIFK